jgi:hypothetical protein
MGMRAIEVIFDQKYQKCIVSKTTQITLNYLKSGFAGVCGVLRAFAGFLRAFCG